MPEKESQAAEEMEFRGVREEEVLERWRRLSPQARVALWETMSLLLETEEARVLAALRPGVRRGLA